MRKTPIGKDVLGLLSEGDLTTALYQFRRECEVKDNCQYSGSVENCKRLCLLPKLLHRELKTGKGKLH